MKRVLMIALVLLVCLPALALADDCKKDCKGEGPKLDVYGFARFQAIYFTQEIARGDWMLYAFPDEANVEDRSVLTMNARHSRLGFKWSDGCCKTGAVSGKIEFDFSGGFAGYGTAARAANVMLRHAWAQYAKDNWAIRFGQDWALIATPFPGTTNFTIGGAMGNLWMRYPQIKFMQKFESGVKWAASVNRPMAGNRAYPNQYLDPIGDGEYTAMPWMMGRLWVPAGNATISVSGHYGQEQIDDVLGNHHDMDTYSINGDIVLKNGAFSFAARGFYGENLNSFLGGILQGFTRAGVNDDGVLEASDECVSNVAAMGGWAQVGYKFNEKKSIVIGGGMDDPDEADLLPGMRDRNDWFFAKLSCNVTKTFSTHLGVDYMKTSYMDNYPLVENATTGEYERDITVDLAEVDPGSTVRISLMTVYKF